MILVFTDITISEESSTEWTGDVWSTSLDPIPTDGKTEQVSLVQNQNYFMTSTASICRWKRVAETCAVTSSMTIPSWRMRKRISDVQTWHNILCQEDTKVVVKVFIKNCALSHQTHWHYSCRWKYVWMFVCTDTYLHIRQKINTKSLQKGSYIKKNFFKNAYLIPNGEKWQSILLSELQLLVFFLKNCVFKNNVFNNNVFNNSVF